MALSPNSTVTFLLTHSPELFSLKGEAIKFLLPKEQAAGQQVPRRRFPLLNGHVYQHRCLPYTPVTSGAGLAHFNLVFCWVLRPGSDNDL